MSNYMENAFAPIEAMYREQMRVATWGHMAPVKDRKYTGRIIFAVGCYGNDDINPTVLTTDVLPNSPWEYDHIRELIWALQKTFGEHNERFNSGCVYGINASCRNYLFEGQLMRLMDFNLEKPTIFPTVYFRTIKGVDEEYDIVVL